MGDALAPFGIELAEWTQVPFTNYESLVSQWDNWAQFSCAVLQNRQIKCWGNNTYGQLGLGDTNNRGDNPGEMGASLPAVDLGMIELGGTCTVPATSPLAGMPQDPSVPTDIATVAAVLYSGTVTVHGCDRSGSAAA
jgi:hypothetical protein